MSEQTARLQELRRQLSSAVGSRSDSGLELQALQEELRLALRREKESQELSRGQAGRVDSLTVTLHVKEEIIRVSQRENGAPLPTFTQQTPAITKQTNRKQLR